MSTSTTRQQLTQELSQLVHKYEAQGVDPDEISERLTDYATIVQTSE